MTILDDMDDAVAAKLGALVGAGRVSYAGSHEWQVDQRRTLGIQNSGADFELTVWERGDVELFYGTPENPHIQYFRALSSPELPALLDRLIAIATTWGEGARTRTAEGSGDP